MKTNQTFKEVFENLSVAQGSIFDLMIAAGLDPANDLRGGDWRSCSFADLDLREFNLRNCRLFQADFSGSLISGADFRGADIEKSTLHRALDYDDAILDDSQKEYIQKRLALDENLKALKARVASDDEISVWQYVRLIKDTPNLSAAKVIYERMLERGIKPNRYIFSAIMAKCEDFEEAENYLELASKEGIEDDVVIYSVLITKTRSFEHAKEILEKVKSLPGKKVNYPYANAIVQAPNLRATLPILDYMWANGPIPNYVTLSAALDTDWYAENSDFDLAFSILKTAVERRVALASANVASLIRRSRSDANTEMALSFLANIGLFRDMQIETGIISVATSFSTAMNSYYDALNRRMPPDKFTYSALMRKAENYRQAFQILAMARNNNVDFDFNLMKRLMHAGPVSPKANSLMRHFEMSGGTDTHSLVKGLVREWSLDRSEQQYWLYQIFRSIGR